MRGIRWNENGQKRTEIVLENLSHLHFVDHKSHRRRSGIKPSHNGEMPANKQAAVLRQACLRLAVVVNGYETRLPVPAR
jgi:hypothetical protein